MFTIITSYREGDCSRRVCLVQGKLTARQRKEIATKLALQPDDSVGFAEVNTLTANQVKESTTVEWCQKQLTRCGRDLVG